MFWAMELLDSMEGYSILEILLYCWFYSAPSAWNFAHLILDLIGKEELEPDELLRAIYALTTLSERDCSVLWLLSEGSEAWVTQPDCVGNIPLPAEFQESSPELQCFVRALLQGKGLLALTLVRHAWRHDTWKILKSCAQQKGVHDDALRLLNRLEADELFQEAFCWEARALGILYATNTYKVSQRKRPLPLKCEVNSVLSGQMKEWSTLEGRRARRKFRIRTEAILWNCERSTQKNTETNIQEIREPLAALRGSPYWETVAEDMGGWKAIRKSDDHKEAFYDLYFPDDIPDEWSMEDQEKSHGRGVWIGSITEDSQYTKQLRSLFTGSVSNGLESLTKHAIGLEKKQCGWNSLYESQKLQWTETVGTWRLSPVQKKIFILQ